MTHKEDLAVENLKGAIQLGAQTLKSLELINGGAAVGILTFYGNVLSRPVDARIDRIAISHALMCFGIGVAAAAIASGIGYLSQLRLAHYPAGVIDNWFRGLAIISGIVSFVVFVIGLYLATVAFDG